MLVRPVVARALVPVSPVIAARPAIIPVVTGPTIAPVAVEAGAVCAALTVAEVTTLAARRVAVATVELMTIIPASTPVVPARRTPLIPAISRTFVTTRTRTIVARRTPVITIKPRTIIPPLTPVIAVVARAVGALGEATVVAIVWRLAPTRFGAVADCASFVTARALLRSPPLFGRSALVGGTVSAVLGTDRAGATSAALGAIPLPATAVTIVERGLLGSVAGLEVASGTTALGFAVLWHGDS